MYVCTSVSWSKIRLDYTINSQFKIYLIAVGTLLEIRTGSSVKDVMLWGVNEESSSLVGDFLRTFVNLECLSSWMKGPPKQGKGRQPPTKEISMIDIHRDLTSGRKLTKVSVCLAALVVHPDDNIADIVKHNMTEFHTISLLKSISISTKYFLN